MCFKNSQFFSQAAQGVSPGSDLHTKSKTTLSFWQIKILFILSCCLLLIPTLGGTAFAYNRVNAIAFADHWALGRNPSYPSYPADCTNFVSQALRYGGYPSINTNGSTTDDSEWWGYWQGLGFLHSNSWSVAPDQRLFQLLHYPGGYQRAALTSSDSAYWYHYDDSSMIGGDELFFDWGQGEGISHLAFQVNAGWSQYTNSWYGDLSDQHVTDRYHVSWNHTEVNSNLYTTTIYEIHIDSGN